MTTEATEQRIVRAVRIRASSLIVRLDSTSDRCFARGKGWNKRVRSRTDHARSWYKELKMARLMIQIGRCAMKTFVSQGRNDLFGSTAQSRMSLVALRSITTTRCLRAGKCASISELMCPTLVSLKSADNIWKE